MKPLHWYLILTLTTLGLTALAFGGAFWHPNDYLFSHAGDMFKAYHAFDYYLQHGDGSWHEGFQYPYGNHLLYLDVNPLLLGALKAIQPIVDLTDYSRAILNLLMMLSLMPCAWLAFGLLRRTKLPPGYSLIMALLITFLSPQIMRMTGAFALAFTFFVPMIWWLSLRVFDRGKKWGIWLIAFAAVVLLFGAMHPYYAFLGAAWLMTYALFHYLQHRQWQENRLRYGLVLVAAIVPGLSLKVWEAMTWQGPDDMVTAPFGLFYYVAHPETIFLPFFPPFSEVWDFFIKVKSVDHEGYAYIGLPGTLIVLALLGRVVKLGRSKKWSRILNPVMPDHLRAAIWPAVLLLVIAMGYPLHWFREWQEVLGPIQQFRSLGRLAWFFYYVVMVLAAWWLYAIWRAIRIHTLGTKLSRLWVAVMAMAMFSWALAGASLIQSRRVEFLNNHLSHFPEKQVDYTAMIEQAGYKVNDFQAILTLPHFHLGSEKFNTSDWAASRAGMAVSAQTGLPLVNNLSARAPLTPTMETLSLTAHPYLPRTLPDKLTKDIRPLLLIWTGESFRPGELYVMSQGKWFVQTDFLHMAKLEVADLTSDMATSSLQRFWDQKDSLESRGPLFATDLTNVYVETFDDRYGEFGGGIVEGNRPKSPVYSIDLAGLQPEQEMELSFWLEISTENDYLPRSWLRQYRGKELLSEIRFEPSHTPDIYGDWSRAGVKFQPAAPDVRLEVWMGGNHHVCDHFLLRPADQDVYLERSADTTVRTMLNNYPLH